MSAFKKYANRNKCFMGNSIVSRNTINCGGTAVNFVLVNFLFKKIPIVSPIFPVILNGIFVGIEFCFFVEKSATFSLFYATFLSVALGELVVCYLLGIPLYFGIKKTGILKGGE